MQPRAKKNAVVGLHGDRLKIQIKAAPTDNKANEELVDFLADYLHMAPSKIHVVSGQHSRNKLVCLKQPTQNIISLLPGATYLKPFLPDTFVLRKNSMI